jgi:phage tail-like protein
VLPDGSPASFYTPIEFVEIQTVVQTLDGAPLPSLTTKGVIVLFVPVRSYLRFLPGIYSASTPVSRTDSVQYDAQTKRRLGVKDHAIVSNVGLDGSKRFQEFMLLFQHMMTKILDKVDDLDKLIDPLNVDAKFLPWLASWLNFHLDTSLPLNQQRELVRRAILLQRIRGTCMGVSEMIRILTSAPVRIRERTKPKSFVLGKTVIGAGKDISDRFLNREPAPSFLLSPQRKDTAFFVIELEERGAFRNRFGDRGPDILRQITQIVSREMPAQVVFTIEFQESKEKKHAEG